MKKIYFVSCLFLIALTATIIVSCVKDSSKVITERESANPFSFVGQMHNDGLDHALMYMKDMMAASGKQVWEKDEVLEICFDGVNAFMAEKGFEESVVTRSDYPWDPADSLGLSELGTIYYDWLMLGIYESETKEEAMAVIYEIEENLLADELIDSDERDLLLCGTAVAAYSHDYWDANIESLLEEMELYAPATRSAGCNCSRAPGFGYIGQLPRGKAVNAMAILDTLGLIGYGGSVLWSGGGTASMSGLIGSSLWSSVSGYITGILFKYY